MFCFRRPQLPTARMGHGRWKTEKKSFLACRAAFADYKYWKTLQVQGASPVVVTAMSTDCYSFLFLHSSANPLMEAGSRMNPDTKAPKSGMFLEDCGQNSEVLLGLNIVQGGQERVHIQKLRNTLDFRLGAF